jgi:hypothetical protein
VKAIETVYNGYRFRSRLEARWAVFFDALGVEYEYEPEGFELPSGRRYLPDFRMQCYGLRGNLREPKDDDVRMLGLCAGCKYRTEEGMYSYMYGCSNKSLELNDHGVVACAECDPDLNGECTRCDGFKLDTGDPFDLYIEVKGRMTQGDASRIREFAGFENKPGLGGGLSSQPVLVVCSVPRDIDEMMSRGWDDMDGTDVYPFNYDTIDGDLFGAYPTARDGRLYLMGADSNYMDKAGIDRLNAALMVARKARFEFGEEPDAREAFEAALRAVKA